MHEERDLASQPQPIERGAPAPELIQGEDWTEGAWSGKPQWTCKLKVRHLGRNEAFYLVPCNCTFFSHDDLMTHFQNHA